MLPSPLIVTDVAEPTDTHVALHTLLRVLSTQYSYDVAPVAAPHESTSPLRGRLVALLAGDVLLNDEGIEPEMTIDRSLVAVRPAVSVARIVKLKVPDVVGVPLIFPEFAVSASPPGSDPLLMAHVYEPEPPVAATVWL